MEHYDQNVSSHSILSLHFRASRNNDNILNTIKNVQGFSTNTFGNLTHSIFIENGAPFILLKTNFSEKPLKLLIDTGASISLVASDMIHDKKSKHKYIVNLFGILGKDKSVQTEGLVRGISSISGCMLGTTLHLIDRKYSGPADGYLGIDFLTHYGSIIINGIFFGHLYDLS